MAAALAVLGVAGAHEVYRLAERTGVRPLGPAGYLGAALLPVGAFGMLSRTLGLAPIGLLIGGTLWFLLVMTIALRLRPPAARPLSSVAVTVFGVAYAAGLPTFLLALRHADTLPTAWAATWLVFLPLVVTWIGDSLAMAGGRLFGGSKMAPVLSPNKTWAGACSGAVAGLVVAPLYGALVLGPSGVTIPVWQLAVFGIAVSIVGQTGDLAESLFKREAGVKDSGSFFPGHGGVLDRLDSLYWVLPSSVAILLLFDVI